MQVYSHFNPNNSRQRIGAPTIRKRTSVGNAISEEQPMSSENTTVSSDTLELLERKRKELNDREDALDKREHELKKQRDILENIQIKLKKEIKKKEDTISEDMRVLMEERRKERIQYEEEISYLKNTIIEMKDERDELRTKLEEAGEKIGKKNDLKKKYKQALGETLEKLGSIHSPARK